MKRQSEDAVDSPSKKQALSSLDKLKELSIIVADTGDFESIKEFEPQDATTNPSLILQASQMDQYKPMIQEVIAKAKAEKVDDLEDVCDRLAVRFGLEILKIVPGYVSTEVSARLSFDVQGSVAKARKLIKMYEDAGIKRDRILIKMATTWEGCEAARILEKEGITCNMTLVFSLIQAAAAADANAKLISPFVGRIMDWYKASTGKTFEPQEDPGVISVTQIYKYFQKFGIKTVVMGASFRNIQEVLELAGCEKLTVSPKLLKELSSTKDDVTLKLTPTMDLSEVMKIEIDETSFRWHLNENQMATEKLSDGIRKFNADYDVLKKTISEMMKN